MWLLDGFKILHPTEIFFFRRLQVLAEIIYFIADSITLENSLDLC